MYKCMGVVHMSAGTQQSSPWSWSYWDVVSYLMWVLGTRLGSCGRAGHVNSLALLCLLVCLSFKQGLVYPRLVLNLLCSRD